MKQTLISQDLDFQKSRCRLKGRLFSKNLRAVHNIKSLLLPLKSTICPIVRRVRTKRTPASSFYFFLFYYHRGKHKVGWHKTFFGPTHYFTLRNSYTTSKVVPFSLLSTQAQDIHQDNKLLVPAVCFTELVYWLKAQSHMRRTLNFCKDKPAKESNAKELLGSYCLLYIHTVNPGNA